MANNYFLDEDGAPISFEVAVGTTVAAGTVADKILVDSSIVEVAVSKPAASGNIPVTVLGSSTTLSGTRLIITTLLKAGHADDLDQVFQHLSMRTTLHGGPDGDRSFSLADADKRKYPATRSIEALIVVKLLKK